jgi:site-specific DNA-methyltransferase (adenine-specific)
LIESHPDCGQPTEPIQSQVIHGDCFEVLPTLPKCCVQTAFVDPPYNIGVDYGEGRSADLLPPDQYIARISRLIRECVYRLTSTGSLWFLSPERWADQVGSLLSEQLPRRNRIIWRETFGQYREDSFPSGHRHLFWHVMDRSRSPFHTDDIRIPSQRMEAGDKRAHGPRVPDDVWEFPRVVGNAKERVRGHPCQLPESLLTRVILCSTSPGDLVLDPMAGTGTTLRVAQRLGRRYLGIERQSDYVSLIQHRLRQDYQQNLFSS